VYQAMCDADNAPGVCLHDKVTLFTQLLGIHYKRQRLIAQNTNIFRYNFCLNKKQQWRPRLSKCENSPCFPIGR